MKKNHVLFPVTDAQFDALVDAVCARFNLTNREHAESVIAIRISHLPPDQASATLEYFGHCVIKNIAFQLAQARCSRAQHKVQIDNIDAVLTASPCDQQALDALQKAVDQGSEYAKKVLDKYTCPVAQLQN